MTAKNQQKNFMTKYKNYTITIREDSKLKVLGFIFGTDLRKTTADNYERIINTINFMINQNCRRNLNQKVWISNTFILAKRWYISQIMPPENLHLGKIKKPIGNFLWFGYLYKIGRRQLVMTYLEGGLALTTVELKTKSLFLRANLFKKVEDIFVDGDDFLFVERKNKNKITKKRAGGIYECRQGLDKKPVVNEVDLLNPFGKARVHELHQNEVHANKF
jgi:hypothetical protein